jgi:glutamate-1-semialdehyde 2,1-aminomutase
MSDKKLLAAYHLELIANYGIFFLPMKMGAISYAHEEGDIKRLLAATEKVVHSGILLK